MSGPKKVSTSSTTETGPATVTKDSAVTPEVLEDDDFFEEEYKPSEADGDMFGGMPAKKAEHFWPSAKRLMGLLKPEAAGIWAVVGLVVVAVVLNVVAPKILGQAMDVIFGGVVGKQLPAGASKDEFVEGLSQQGQDNFADMISKMELVTGTGIDFQKLSVLIAIVLLM